MKNQKNDYFDMMEKLVDFSVRAADLLTRILKDYQPERVPAWRSEMHAIEHAADDMRHDTLQKLSREFITPIEQEDILHLVQIIDDVTDAIDEVVIDLYMFNIRSLPVQTLSLAEHVSACVTALQKAVAQLRNFKKPDLLKPLIIQVNSIESKADETYIEAMRALFMTERAPWEMMGIRQIYDGLENCCDLCEHAADVIESTLMKNA